MTTVPGRAVIAPEHDGTGRAEIAHHYRFERRASGATPSDAAIVIRDFAGRVLAEAWREHGAVGPAAGARYLVAVEYVVAASGLAERRASSGYVDEGTYLPVGAEGASS